VVLLPDGVRNYMTKFLDDNWLADRDIIQIQASTIGHHPDPGEYNQTSSRSRRVQSRKHPDPGEYNPENIQIHASTILKTSRSRRVQS
jgi:hypothetical protein